MIRRGQFHLLFHAGSLLEDVQLGVDVPETFEPLTIGTTEFRLSRGPDCLSTNTVEESGVGFSAALSAQLCVPPLEPSSSYLYIYKLPRPVEAGAHLTLSLTGNRGAALMTRHPTTLEDAMSECAFEDYTKRHYKSWVAFARGRQYGYRVRPILVSGFDMTKDFAMLAYSNGGSFLEGGSDVSVPMFASASVSVRVTRHAKCSPHVHSGPQPWDVPQSGQAIDFPSSQSTDPRTSPDEFNQCLFIRYYTGQPRGWLVPKVLKAGAGPQDLGSGDNKGETFPEQTAQYDVEPISDGDEDPGGQPDLTTANSDSDTITVVRNTPDVWFLPPHFISALTFSSRMGNTTPGMSLQIIYFG